MSWKPCSVVGSVDIIIIIFTVSGFAYIVELVQLTLVKAANLCLQCIEERERERERERGGGGRDREREGEIERER